MVGLDQPQRNDVGGYALAMYLIVHDRRIDQLAAGFRYDETPIASPAASANDTIAMGRCYREPRSRTPQIS
jgi:hypothetical protein